MSQIRRLSVEAASKSVLDSGSQHRAFTSSLTYAKLIFSSVMVSGSTVLYILPTEQALCTNIYMAGLVAAEVPCLLISQTRRQLFYSPFVLLS